MASSSDVDGEGTSGTTFSAESFFATQEPPPRLKQYLDAVREFVQRHAKENRRIVLVTSGGTTVPLEHNLVRFLDNFSAGTRGAASAEQFLRTGQYAVIFLHRQYSLQPFSRHYSHSTNPFLDLLEISPTIKTPPAMSPSLSSTASPSTSSSSKPHPEHLFPSLSDLLLNVSGAHASATPRSAGSAEDDDGGEDIDGDGACIKVRAAEQAGMMRVLLSYKIVQSRQLLHSIPFVTVFDYLFLLRGIAQIMNGSPETRPGQGVGVGRRGMYYLAAAVSDFFLPQQKMSQHKIQSGKGSLLIEMDQVPKILRSLVQEWSADGYIVSFKLETDRELLIPKARHALKRYGHQIVIANDLNTRKHEVLFVQPEREEWLRITEAQVEAGTEIEEEIVAKLIELHTVHIEKIGQQKKAEATSSA